MAVIYLMTHSNMTESIAEGIQAKSGMTDALAFPDGQKKTIINLLKNIWLFD